jgi:hypothetical protein
LFKDEAAYEEIDEYFHHFCYEKEECVVDLEKLPERPFSDMISDFCVARIVGDKNLPDIEQHQTIISSNEMVFIIGCKGSTYKINSFVLHK